MTSRINDPPLWQWPSDASTSGLASEVNDNGDTENTYNSNEPTDPPPDPPKKYYPPRECRICLETVLPTLRPLSENLPEFLQSAPRVVYESTDPELGRLLRPCQCKGSSRYVHEGCLQAWRHADPDYTERNYYNCPTCGFQYRLDRLTWARLISSTVTQLALTVAILMMTVFLLGFIADPIINLYVDPMDTVYYSAFWDDRAAHQVVPEDSNHPWIEHFSKGLASLGVLSFVKGILALSPWQWWNVRGSGFITSGRTTSRNRMASISWLPVLIGVLTFLWSVYKGIRAWSRKTLEKAGERVLDVPLPDDDDEGEDSDAGTSPEEPGCKKDE
ncbi:hypothetical protein FE257_004680 [Aspergillus nanangensis]|uniref:RING-CH-type domain-containing protein n=1 Tax=Aspergillus nanangensis TaxID=2582783 RepID=A0AAD4D0F8_ASPNN|nr:hypothetical protein FE257_004680 [Aspergillus nanangensis]